MNLPNLPTDSLYKFCALTGLAICLFGLYLATFNFMKYEEITTEMESEYEILKAETQNMEGKIDLLKTIGSDDGKHHVQILELVSNVNLINAKLAGKLKASEMYKNRSSRALDLGTFLTLLGIYISAQGFYLWYTRVQKPADDLIKKQIENF